MKPRDNTLGLAMIALMILGVWQLVSLVLNLVN